MTPDELGDLMRRFGEPIYRAKQIFSRLCAGETPVNMSALPKSLRTRLESDCFCPLPGVAKKLTSKKDGTIKYLFSLYDGNCVEGVLMRYEHGNTLCISSQVGCRMGCAFCASAIGGKVRDLLPSEMLGQVITAGQDSGVRISNIVMMGIGEPLDNYRNVIKFLKLVQHPQGLNIGYRRISLSTCGLADRIHMLAEENLPITLSISLHAADDKTRSSIMPVNNKWNISELLDACRGYYLKTGRRISFEYALIAGKNDSKKDAEKLASLLNSSLRRDGGKFPIHVNLIPVNQVDGKPFAHSDVKTVTQFVSVLKERGVRATVRRKLGSDINAACGQLRRNSLTNNS